MIRYISRTFHVVQNSSANYNRFLIADYDAAILSVSTLSPAKYLSTYPARLCRNTHNPQNADKGQDQTATKTVKDEETQDSDEINKIVKSNQGDNNLKNDSKGKVAAPVAAKSGKDNLLDLLGAMKVDVTSKRRLQNVRVSVFTPKSTPRAMESTNSMFQKAPEEATSQIPTLDPELLSAASAAASTFPNSVLAESELVKQLRKHEAITEAHRKGDVNDLGVIIADMKVGRNSNRQHARAGNQIRFDDDDDGRGYMQDRGITAELDSVRRKKNLFTGRRLNIFSSTVNEDGEVSTFGRPTLWDTDFADQLASAANQLPRNAFEEMIQWTKEGKMWQYPIENEAGLEEEASIPFHEHVFLDKHLEEGFPKQGPVRHFMELVVTGLSRNPYLTVQDKREHISWFRDYFNQKQDVLKEAEVYAN
ncbi:small ribosomal subunit protein mS31 [Stigmatopora argus]